MKTPIDREALLRCRAAFEAEVRARWTLDLTLDPDTNNYADDNTLGHWLMFKAGQISTLPADVAGEDLVGRVAKVIQKSSANPPAGLTTDEYFKVIARAAIACITRPVAGAGELERLFRALVPVMLTAAPKMQSGTCSAHYERGLSYTKSQVREIQEAAAAVGFNYDLHTLPQSQKQEAGDA